MAIKNTVDVKRATLPMMKAVYHLARKYAADAEKLAQQMAPWKDQTGDARRLLKGQAWALDAEDIPIKSKVTHTRKNKDGTEVTTEVGVEDIFAVPPNSIGFFLAHRVVYGKHLEEANDGTYAVLDKAAKVFAKRFKDAAREVLTGKP